MIPPTVGQLERLRELQGKRELSPKESKELELLSDTVSADLLALGTNQRSGGRAGILDRFIQALEKAKASGDL